MSSHSGHPLLYLAIDGQPAGPYSREQVKDMRSSGRIGDATLICPDGGTGWKPLREFDPGLCPVLPPLPSAGYARVSPAANVPAVPSLPAAAASPAPASTDAAKPFHFGALVAALVCFFVPWLEVRCTDMAVARQSGIQLITGRLSVDETTAESTGLRSASGGGPRKPAINPADESSGSSWLAALALVLVVAATVAAAVRSAVRTSGLLAIAAAGCLLVQWLIGFPLESAVKKAVASVVREKEEPDDPVALSMMTAIVADVQPAPGFYCELAALVAAGVLGFVRTGRLAAR